MDKVFSTLKLAVQIVLVGGAAAWTAGTLSARTVHAELAAHTQGRHAAEVTALETMRGEFTGEATAARQQATEAHIEAAKASWSAEYTQKMTERLLMAQGVPVPRPPPRPKVLRPDGGD